MLLFMFIFQYYLEHVYFFLSNKRVVVLVISLAKEDSLVLFIDKKIHGV